MPFRRSISALRLGPITLAYRRRVQSGNLRLDEAQLSLSAALDDLYSSLASSSSSSGRRRRRRWVIPEEYMEAAARYYNDASSSSSSSFSLFSAWSRNSTKNNLAGMAVATVHSFWNRTRPMMQRNMDGIYIHGSVGVGKSMLMDLFHSVCANGLDTQQQQQQQQMDSQYAERGEQNSNLTYHPISMKHRRCHFHEFMLDVHQRIHVYKANHPKADPIPPVAAALAKEATLLCFDEMQITDIADAMIIKRLLTLLLDLGVVIVTTSNRPPCHLYEGGINRSLFVPFIDTLNERLKVMEMTGTHDYRKGESSVTTSVSDSAVACLPAYVYPSNTASSKTILDRWMKSSNDDADATIRTETIPVAMGRTLAIRRANDSCARCTFRELCHEPLGAADYLAIARRFDTVIVEDVPQLGGHVYNEARRFVTLIDALYEARTTLIVAAEVPMEELFVGFDASVESHDGDEEIAMENESTATTTATTAKTIQRDDKQSMVLGEGGSSSSSSTTYIRNDSGDGSVEWSATGRIGVSLAQLSSVREVSFSFQRAESRLAEMTGTNWGR